MSHDIAIALDAAGIIALSTAIGTCACLLWVAPAGGGANAGQLRRVAWRLLGVCLVLLSIDSIATLVVRAHVMSGQPYSRLAPVLSVVVEHTHFGHLWMVRLISLGLLGLVWRAGRSRGDHIVWPWILLAGLAVVAFTRSATGHAADQGDFTARELMDWLHILAASAWGGTVAAAALTLFGGAGPFTVRAYRLSALVTVTLPLVLGTGIYNAWRQFGIVGELWETEYGIHFLVKMALVAVMLGLGAFNRFFHLNGLSQPAADASGSGEEGARRAFRRVLIIEALVAVSVFVAVAFMVNTAPPREAAAGMLM